MRRVFMSSKKKYKQTRKKTSDRKAMMMTSGLVVLLLIVIGIFVLSESGGQDGKDNKMPLQKTGDVVIDKSKVNESATFYPYEVDGVSLEVMAIKASDGTVRTAFNTCQVCYASGKGYYKQEGDILVCQNCRNTFTADDVEVASGGCNPVPIFEENKTETEDTITINEDIIKEAKDIFLNWKENF